MLTKYQEGWMQSPGWASKDDSWSTREAATRQIIQKYIAAIQGSEAAAITAGAINCLSTKELENKTTSMWLRGEKATNSFPYPIANSKGPKRYENGLSFPSAFYLNTVHVPAARILVAKKSWFRWKQLERGEWKLRETVHGFNMSPAYLPYTYDIQYIIYRGCQKYTF